MHARRTSPATDILTGHPAPTPPRALPRSALTATPATPASPPPHPPPPVPVRHNNSRRDTPAGRLPPAARGTACAGNTGQAVSSCTLTQARRLPPGLPAGAAGVASRPCK